MTVHFFRLFTGEGDKEYTGAAVIQNTEAYRLEHCPECHLAQICLRKGVDEHVLLFVGNLKGLAIPRVWAKMLSCKLLSTNRRSVSLPLTPDAKIGFVYPYPSRCLSTLNETMWSWMHGVVYSWPKDTRATRDQITFLLGSVQCGLRCPTPDGMRWSDTVALLYGEH